MFVFNDLQVPMLPFRHSNRKDNLFISNSLQKLVAPQGFTNPEKSIRYVANSRCSPQHSPHEKILFHPLIPRARRSTFWDSLGHCGKAPTHLQEIAIAMREVLMENREKTISGEAVL
jgi:hypothetical protein